MNLAFSMKSFSKDNNAISDTVTDTYQVQSNIQNMVAYNVQPYNHSHNVLKNLQDKADRIKKQSEKPIELGVAQPVATHKQYEKIIQGLLISN